MWYFKCYRGKNFKVPLSKNNIGCVYVVKFIIPAVDIKILFRFSTVVLLIF